MRNKLFFITLLSITSLTQLIQAAESARNKLQESIEKVRHTIRLLDRECTISRLEEKKLISTLMCRDTIQEETIERQQITLEYLTNMLDFGHAKNHLKLT